MTFDSEAVKELKVTKMNENSILTCLHKEKGLTYWPIHIVQAMGQVYLSFYFFHYVIKFLNNPVK